MNYGATNLAYLLRKCGLRLDAVKIDIISVKPGVEGFVVDHEGKQVVITTDSCNNYSSVGVSDFVVNIDDKFYDSQWKAIRYLIHSLC